MVDFTPGDALIRFDSLICRNRGPHGCWAWLGARTAEGYGSFRTQRGGTRGRLAHRWHWLVRVGPLRPDHALDHICRNRACVRLDHLAGGGRRCRICHGEGIRLGLQKERAAPAQAQADAFRNEYNRLPHLGNF